MTRLEHWENYYRRGALVTCPTGTDANYTADLRHTWVEFFEGLGPGARIVDVGTGNGPVPLIAKEVAERAARSFEIHGVDLAQIDPRRDVPGGDASFAGVCFHAGVGAEALPFETGSFDAVTGNFALEYSDTARSIPELHRVLKPGGRARFVLHHRDSVVLSNAAGSFDQFRLVFDETRILRKLRRYLDLDRDRKPGAARASNELTVALRQIDAGLAGRPVGQSVLAGTGELVRQCLSARRALPVSALEARIAHFDRDLREAMRRLQDLQRCALGESQMRELVRQAAATGLTHGDVGTVQQGGRHLIGWRWDLQR